MADDLRLTIMTFPQSWDGKGTLTLNVLLLPSTDPLTQPLIGANPAVPAFARSTPELEVRLNAGLTGRPTTSGAILLASSIVPSSPAPDPVVGFTALRAKVTAAGTSIGTIPAAAPRTHRIRKALPRSYLAAGGDGPDGDTTTTDDDFACAVRSHAKATPVADPPPPKPPITWGEVISYAMRQPEVADWLGLRYRLKVKLDPKQVEAGAFVFVTLAATDTWAVAAATTVPPDQPIRVHAARIPPLDGTARAVFAAVQFHVDSTSMGALDDAVVTAETYADGFAKLVHCFQPMSAEPTVDDGRIPPSCELGLQIGWDDTQVVDWLNDQLKLLDARRGGNLTGADQQPLGVLGYRIDVADVTPSTPGGSLRTPAWQSLVHVTANLGAPLGSHSGELSIQPVPTKPRSAVADDDAWLPRYFATWRGGSMCERDDIPRILSSSTHAVPPPPTRVAKDLTTLLSYGRTYAFRVRLCDLSSGGPDPKAEPIDPTPTSIATHAFRRMVAPKAPGIVRDGGPTNPTPRWLDVTRPKITYPEVLYTSLGDTAGARDAIRTDLVAQAGAKVQVAGLPDPDVDAVGIEVAVRHLLHDTVAAAGPYVTVYTTTRALTAPTGTAPLLADPGTHIDLAYVEVPDLIAWSPPVATSGPVAIPRGRDIRVTVRSRLRGSARPDYLGEPATRCLSAAVDVRCEPASEPAMLVAAAGQPPIRGLRFGRPPDVAAPPLVAQLAEQLGVAANGDSLTSPPGRRTVFAASASLRHRVSADGEQLTLSAPTQLLRNWIVPIVIDLSRDWTWDALLAEGIDVLRDGNSIGAIHLPRVLGALAGVAPIASDWRRATRLVFLDAVDPHEDVPGATFSQALTRSWMLVPKRTPKGPPSAGAAAPGKELAESPLVLTLPIAIPPVQVPKLASIGLAQSPYVAGAGYASTEARRRGLWIELTEPVANTEGHALFARVLAHGVDPILYAAKPIPTPKIIPPLPLDPELLRVVVPNDTDDRAGEDALVRLTPSPDSDRHFLLPLPPGVSADDPELFGFYSYELRIGHTSASGQLKWWSTASARFGTPLRVVGIQHPVPALVCRASHRRLSRIEFDGWVETVDAAAGDEVQRRLGLIDRVRPTHIVYGSQMIVATATYATPTLDGTPVAGPDEEPLSELWFCLYAQVAQVDASSMRNILLINLPGTFLSRRRAAADAEVSQLFDGYLKTRRRDRMGYAIFREGQIGEMLGMLHLPPAAPLSALAVELLPPGTGTKVGFDRFHPSASPLVRGTVDEPRGAPPFPFGRILRVSPLTPVQPLC